MELREIISLSMKNKISLKPNQNDPFFSHCTCAQYLVIFCFYDTYSHALMIHTETCFYDKYTQSCTVAHVGPVIIRLPASALTEK